MTQMKTVVNARTGVETTTPFTSDEVDEYNNIEAAITARSVTAARERSDIEKQSKMLQAIVEYFRIEVGVSSEDARTGIATIYNGV